MRRDRITLIVLTILLPILVFDTKKADAQVEYSLATATAGGTYHPVGVAISNLIDAQLASDGEDSIRLIAKQTAGSGENVRLLRSDDSQFAILSGLAAYQASSGLGKFADAGAYQDFRAIASLWASTDHFILRSDLVRSGTVADLFDHEGLSASFGKKGSGTLLKNELFFERLGASSHQFDLVQEGYKGSVELFADNKIAAMNLSGGKPVAAVTDTLGRIGAEAVLLEVSDDQLARLDAGTGLWTRDMIPAGTYPGQIRDLASVATPNILAVRSDIPEETVYRITQAIFDNLDQLQQMHPATAQIKLDQAAVGLPVPMHAGAQRYFEERGLRVPVADSGFGESFLARYQTREQARTAVNRGRVGIVTGPSTQTSSRAIGEVAAAVEHDDLRLITMTGKGSGQNVTDLLYLGGVDAAVVQLDYLKYAEEYAYPDLQESLRILTPLFDEEVHVVVKLGIFSFSQLAGKKVNFGSRGSGNELTSEILFRHLDTNVQRTFFDDRQALELLKAGEIDAAVFVSGKPMPLLETVTISDGLRLLDVPPVDYKGSYVTSTINNADYPWLIRSEGVKTIAVPSAIAAYNWEPDTARYRGVRRLAERLIDNIDKFGAVGQHPKLKEVDPLADFGGWPRLDMVDDYMARRGLAPKDTSTARLN